MMKESNHFDFSQTQMHTGTTQFLKFTYGHTKDEKTQRSINNHLPRTQKMYFMQHII